MSFEIHHFTPCSALLNLWEVNCQNSSGKQNVELRDDKELFTDTSPKGVMTQLKTCAAESSHWGNMGCDEGRKET